RLGVLRLREIDAADPVALLLQSGREMVADKAAGAGDENFLTAHALLSAVTSSRWGFAAIGMRQPVPKARSVTFRPGAACLRLNSAIRTSRRTRVTVSASKPAAMISPAGWCFSMCR